MPNPQKHCTLQKSVQASGIGLFTGQQVSICLRPAPEGTGICFQRTDLPHQPTFKALAECVQISSRCTVLGNGKESIQTVEHLLAALCAYGVDNLFIEVSGPEIPIFDGSSKYFVELIEEAGVQPLEGTKEIFRLKEPVFLSKGDVHLIALPCDEYRISYTLHYPDYLPIGTQFYTFSLDQNRFKNEIASSRTFSVYEEIAPMIEKGLVRGGSLDNAVIFKEGVVVNPEGLRYSDEMVRHKLLDLLGDLYLIPPFFAHIIAIRSGHASNNAFAKQLLGEMTKFSSGMTHSEESCAVPSLNCITVENS